MNYTKRDHDTFSILKKYSDGDTVVIPNRILAAELGISPGAAVPRLDRLRDLGVIRVDYDINPKNGNVKKRTINILVEPPAPYDGAAEVPKSAASEAVAEVPEAPSTSDW